jgi:hypothetical protein
MTMTTESELEVRFRRFLVDRLSYPEKAIVTQYAIAMPGGTRPFHPDLVVMDEATATPLAIFEFRAGPADSAVEAQLVRAAELSALIGNVPAYLVAPGDESEGFRISSLVLTEQIPGGVPTSRHLPLEAVPTYAQLLLASGTAQRRLRVRHTLNWFSPACHVLGLLVAVLFCYSYFGKHEISPSQLGVLGAALALFVIPYAAKLKMLGVEFERRTDSSQQVSRSGRHT